MIRPPSFRDHLPRHALQAEEHALGVDAMDAVPVGLGQVHDVGAPCDAGVVHQDVDLAERRQCLLHHGVDLAEVADIGRHRHRAALERGDGIDRCLRPRRVDVGGDNLSAGLGQRQSACAADA